MDPLLLVIFTFGPIFVVSASLAQGLSMPLPSFGQGLGADPQVDATAPAASGT